MSDDEIVKLYADKDEKAIAATKEKYHNYLYKISFQILGNHEDAEECLDDVFLEAWNAASNIYVGCLQAFLVKLTKRISIDRLRKRNRQKRIPAECISSLEEIEETVFGGVTPETELDKKLLNGAINRFLGTLSKEKRSLFIGRYYYYDSLKDVAAYCGISEGKAKSTLFRLRKELKIFLEKEGFEI